MVRKTKEEALETRNAILDAAEIVFQERGVSKTSLAEIAAAAGVTRGAIYWHFANKVDLFDAMIQRVFGLMEAKLADLQAQKHENPVDLLRELAFYFIDRVVNDQRYYRILEISWHKCEYVGEMAEIRDSHLECGNRFMGVSIEAFRLSRELGFFPENVDPHLAAVGLITVVDGMVTNWTLDKSSFPLAIYGPRIIDAYLAGLRFVGQESASE